MTTTDEPTDWTAVRPGDPDPTERDLSAPICGHFWPDAERAVDWGCTRPPHGDATHVAAGLGPNVMAVQLADGRRFAVADGGEER